MDRVSKARVCGCAPQEQQLGPIHYQDVAAQLYMPRSVPCSTALLQHV